MTVLLKELQREHREMVLVLNVIQLQIDAVLSAQFSDHELLRDAVYYMTQYPDLFHHVKEDFVYRRLRQRDPNTRALVREMLEQHDRLRELGLVFLDVVEDMAAESIVERRALGDKGQLYVDVQRQHIRQEETQVFPISRNTLASKDWRELVELLPLSEASRLHQSARRQFRTLFESISQPSGGQGVSKPHDARL